MTLAVLRILPRIGSTCITTKIPSCQVTPAKLDCLYFLGCGEQRPVNESSYRASSKEQPARFAALDTSNPGASRFAWCRALNDVGGYIEINLGGFRILIKSLLNSLLFQYFLLKLENDKALRKELLNNFCHNLYENNFFLSGTYCIEKIVER